MLLFVDGNHGVALIEFLYLGAKHMVTGYDHPLFLAGGGFLSLPHEGRCHLRYALHHWS